MIRMMMPSASCRRRCSSTVVSLMMLIIMVMMMTTMVQSQATQSEEIWMGCINPEQSNNKIQIQQPTRICINIGNATNWSTGISYIRTNFEPQADIYSRFYIPNSYRDIVQNKNSNGNIYANSDRITISTTSQTGVSFVKVYYDSATKYIFPFLTAIIDVENGIIRGITWDNACVFCNALQCIENTYNYNGIAVNSSTAGQSTKSCYITKDECDMSITTNSSSTICDITVYVVWTGTDRNGIALQSQSYRFSEFPPQQLSDRISQLLIPDTAADVLNNNNITNTNNRQRQRDVIEVVSNDNHEQPQHVVQTYVAPTNLFG